MLYNTIITNKCEQNVTEWLLFNAKWASRTNGCPFCSRVTHLVVFWVLKQQSLHSDTFILTESTTVSSLRHIYSDWVNKSLLLILIINYLWFISLYNIKSVNTIWKLSLGQYGKNQSNTDIFRIGTIPVSPITAGSESARHFDNWKEKSRELLDWLINKCITTWCFWYWSSYRSSVCCNGVRLRLRPIQQASGLWLGQYEKHHVIIL